MLSTKPPSGVLVGPPSAALQVAEHGVELVAQARSRSRRRARRRPRAARGSGSGARGRSRSPAARSCRAAACPGAAARSTRGRAGACARRLGGRGERQPAVAAQAAVPPGALHLAGEGLVLGAQLGRVEPDELVPAQPADQQLPMEPGPEAARLTHSRQHADSLGARSELRALRGPNRPPIWGSIRPSEVAALARAPERSGGARPRSRRSGGARPRPRSPALPALARATLAGCPVGWSSGASSAGLSPTS